MNSRNILFVITGDGKGKTTSAVGQAIRCTGAGGKVLFIQFFKPGSSSEIKILREIGVMIFADEKAVLPVDLNDQVIINRQLKLIEKMLNEDLTIYNLIVLDEFNLLANALSEKRNYFSEVLKQLLKNADIITTGRNAPEWLIEAADTVSIIVNKKHHYELGIPAKEGREF